MFIFHMFHLFIMFFFIHNAPSHLGSLIACFSHVKIVFLPENTTSKLQPLNTGVIKNFNVFYGKQLLQPALARIKAGPKASHVMSNVNLLKTIG